MKNLKFIRWVDCSSLCHFFFFFVTCVRLIFNFGLCVLFIIYFFCVFVCDFYSLMGLCVCVFFGRYFIWMPLLHCWRWGLVVFRFEIKFNICHIGFMSSLYFSSSIILYYPQVLNFTKFNNGEKHQVAEAVWACWWK